MKTTFAILVTCCLAISVSAQQVNLAALAHSFIQTLNKEQQLKTIYPFESAERFNFHFIPKTDRKGININSLTDKQRTAGLKLLSSCLSREGFDKANSIMQLETILKALEKRAEDDHYRDTGNYYFLIFGQPEAGSVWGWRFEGHHISYSFSANKNQLVSGTPGFFGSNPAIVKEGPEKGRQILKREADLAFDLLHSLTAMQKETAILPGTAPNDILSFVQKNPAIENNQGIRYNDLDAAQQEKLRSLINVYIHRYTRLFAESMLKDIQQEGLDKLRFLWIGSLEPDNGKAHYYRIQGPTLLIEYDNSQNNANHVHSVLRDLKNDFGGNALIEHYQREH
jgi:hypothetical protein